MTDPIIPPVDGVKPDAPADAPEVKAPTAEDIAKLNAALDKERDLRKAAEKSVKDFDTQRRAAMTEAERAVAEAEERGRLTAVTAYGQRLARTEYIAEAARRNPGFDAAGVLEDINVAKFIGEDGEPDSKAIAASVARLVPASGAVHQSTDVGQGPRGTAAVPDMNTFIRKATGRA